MSKNYFFLPLTKIVFFPDGEHDYVIYHKSESNLDSNYRFNIDTKKIMADTPFPLSIGVNNQVMRPLSTMEPRIVIMRFYQLTGMCYSSFKGELITKFKVRFYRVYLFLFTFKKITYFLS